MFPWKSSESSTHSLSLREFIVLTQVQKESVSSRGFHKRIANMVERRGWDFTKALTGFKSGHPIEIRQEVKILYLLLVTAFKTQNCFYYF